MATGETGRAKSRSARAAVAIAMASAGGILAASAAGIVAFRARRHILRFMHPERRAVEAAARTGAFATLEDVAFVDANGVTLRGWYVPSRNRGAVILTHGHDANRNQQIEGARILADAGFGVLLFDWQAHGESDGARTTFGDEERENLMAAIAFVAARPDVDHAKIGAIGMSMGGYAVASVAAKDPRLRAIALHHVATSVEDHETDIGPKLTRVFVASELWTLRSRGIDVAATRPIDFVANVAPRPIFILGGGRDRAIPRARTEQLFRAAREPKMLWVVDDAAHVDLARAAPDEYARRVVSFFEEGLGVAHSS